MFLTVVDAIATITEKLRPNEENIAIVSAPVMMELMQKMTVVMVVPDPVQVNQRLALNRDQSLFRKKVPSLGQSQDRQ